MIFGTPEHDAKTGEYLGQVGGVVNKVKGLFAGLRAAGKGILGACSRVSASRSARGSGAVRPGPGFLGEIPGRAAAVDLLAKKFGTTTEEVSALAYAFEQQGVGFDAFQGTLEGLATTPEPQRRRRSDDVPASGSTRGS
jgi:hypothetical protein